MGRARSAADRSLTRLATGKRINRAADDPAGMVAVTNLRADRITLERKIEGFERESSFLGAKDGALSALGELLISLEATVVSAANADVLSDAEKDALQAEADGLLSAIDHVSTTAVFNQQDLLRGYRTNTLGSDDGDLNDLRELFATGDFEAAQSIVEGAQERVNGERGRIGGRLLGLDAERNALSVAFENVSSAISMIEDTDIAAEVSELVRAQILEQASVQVMLVHRDQAQASLKLLEGAFAFSSQK